VRDGFRGQVLVARGDRVLYQRSGGHGVRPVTLFYVASITKSLTATAIFKLRDQGRLSLNDPITRFFHRVPPDKQMITVAELLTHTSGYSDNYAADGFTDHDAAVAAVMARPMKGRVGKDFNYSNDNYALLGAIVEIVSATRYDDRAEGSLRAGGTAIALLGIDRTGRHGPAGSLQATLQQGSQSAELGRPRIVRRTDDGG